MEIPAEKIISCEHFPNGGMRSCALRGRITLNTSCGEITPKYDAEDGARRSPPSVTFYRGGGIRAVQLDKRSDISTSAGIYPATLVMFHEDGSLKRFYTGADAHGSAPEERLSFTLLCGAFCAGVFSVSFYKSGAPRAFSLAAGEVVELETGVGKLPVRYSFTLYENGSVKSAEPAYVLQLDTPVGRMEPYDRTAAADGDAAGSLSFDRRGKITSFRLSDVSLNINTMAGGRLTVEPVTPQCGMDMRTCIPRPLTVKIEDGSAVISGGRETVVVPVNGASITPVRQSAV